MIKISKWIIPQILIFMVLGLKETVLCAFFFILAHECAHYFVAKKIGISISEFQIGPLGASIEIDDFEEASFKNKIIICISGPLLNLIFALIFYVLYFIFKSELFKCCLDTNIVLCIFNMIPAYPLDGARIVRSFLTQRMLYKKAHKITSYLSYFFGGIFLALFIFSIFIHKMNISLLICFIFILVVTYSEKERVMYVIMSDIFKKKRNFMKNKSISVYNIAIHKEETLLNAFSSFQKNKFNSFLVLDDDMNVSGIAYEDDIINGLKEYGNITLSELLDKNKS